MRIERLAVVLCGFGLLGACAEESDPPVPLQDTYRFTMQAGRMCIHPQAHTGAAPGDMPAPVPVRFEACIYRCVEPTGAVDFIRAWSCTNGNCTYELVPTAVLETISNEQDCDERVLADPPADECSTYTWDDFNISPPVDNMDEFVVNTYTMHLPYLTFEEGEELVALTDGGTGTLDALDQIVGNQVISEREIDVEFDPSHPELTHDDLTDADCIEFGIPDFVMQ